LIFYTREPRLAKGQSAGDVLLGSLTKREHEVLAKLTLSLTNKQIAQDLDLSTRTIEMHRAKLIRRLGVRTSFDAIRLALKQPSPGAK
jgi:FixJ family two-component response regulator